MSSNKDDFNKKNKTLIRQSFAWLLVIITFVVSNLCWIHSLYFVFNLEKKRGVVFNSFAYKNQGQRVKHIKIKARVDKNLAVYEPVGF